MANAVFDGVSGYLDHPVKGASTAFAILFATSGVLHIFQNSKYKCWHLLWLLPCASTIFVAGFICREYNAYRPQNDSTFTASQGLLFSGAPIISSTLYLLLFRLTVTQPQLSPLRPSLIIAAASFSLCVLISLTSQGTSTFFSPYAPNRSIRAGLAILKASLILLLVFNICFIGLLGMFHRRCSKARIFGESGNRKIKIVTFTLYASASLILVHGIYRTVQIFSPSSSPAWKTEAFFWVFDAVPLLICMFVLNVLHPGKLLIE